MASIKALAAIGLMIVIVAPIGLGYVFAIDEGETTGWETVDRSNISDLILNSKTDYYMEYSGPYNNNALLITQGATTTIGTPDYISTSEVYSSMPEYRSESNTKQIGSTVTETVTPIQDLIYSLGRFDGDTSLSPGDMYTISLMTASQSNYIMVIISTEDDPIEVRTVTDILAIRDGVDSWKVINPDLPGGQVVAPGVGISGRGTFSIERASYTDIGEFESYATFRASKTSIKLDLADGGAIYRACRINVPVTVTPGTVFIDNETFTSVTKVSIAGPSTTLSYDTITPTGKYVQIDRGWTLPTARAIEWFNGMENRSITIYLALDGGTVTIANDGVPLTITGTDTIKVNGQPLGGYRNVKIVIDTDGYRVTGITEWPSVGGTAREYNSVSIDSPSPTIKRLTLSGGATFRVDRAEILAGQFASTRDYTLDLESLYPGKSLLMELSGIGVYGDSLGIGATVYPVEDGKITIAGKTYPVKGIKIAAMETEGKYIITVNGDEIGEADGYPSITLGGEWSLGAVVYTLQETTIKTYSWIPGGYAFDKQSLAAAGLICCGIAFLVLGLTGRESGPKVALLGLVLGGAGFVYLTIL